MKKFLIQVGVVVSLTGAIALPAHAEHQDFGFAFDIGRAFVAFNDGYRRHEWRDYRYERDVRHARKHQRKHRRQHRRDARRHDGWHWRNDSRWDRYYNEDQSDVHRDKRHGQRDSHRRQRHHG